MNRLYLLSLFALFSPLATTRAEEPNAAVLRAEQQRIEVIKSASATTVAVFDSSGKGGGSGVLISADGFVLTNFHVIASSGAAMKCGLNNGKTYDAVIVGIDPVGDVALIQLFGRDDFPFSELGNSDLVTVGDWVFTAGNPFLLADDFHPSIAWGMVSGVQRYQYPAGNSLLEYADCIQVDAAINPGNSGGPLFNDHGKLIGINGRGSFEKRGRVNVGVGYAISINQIKLFLAHLKSGRIVDHATLGALVSTGEEGQVLVDEILDTCDAYRRGLRYGDQLVRFAGREITTANRLKNILGIFPRGWQVPITYRRDGQSYNTSVRLMGVHDQSQLYDLVQKEEAKPPERPEGPKRPGEEDSEKGEGDQDSPLPKLPDLKQFTKKKLPPAVDERFIARRGYANYWYNEQKQKQLWGNYPEREFLTSKGYSWQLQAERAAGDEVLLVIDRQRATLSTPQLDSNAKFTDDLETQLSPPNSGGLLLTLHLWQRLLDKGLRKYGEVYYLGQLPSRGDGELVDCLMGIYAGIETCFQFNTATGELVGIVMQPRADTDPCELLLSDYQEVDGQRLPRSWQVFYGERQFADLAIKKWQFKPKTEGVQN